ncbi:SGNH/GDSL hydrolase family protein [Rathayibacter sp. VKM Ac-2928]|uniref:SGNH/GDSL hydrolase family protein n=1 Tax=Rathayibacter sp. VKM Ac-2928 TaxID=2929479 RepID=UPI001FB549E0|nr:SGNH/GDSL hydrolase family protein [Rathayibacter sp. VKM Ac-2928]MCJ1682393.1 GDSL-type esterase/lipase family protein [Rathayibacter sp. VKM Ac-2928]
MRTAAIVAALAVTGTAVVFLLPDDRSAVEIPLGATFSPTAAVPPVEPPDPIVLPSRPRVLVFGDSYTAGYGSTDPATDGFARVLPRYLPSWDLAVEGVGSTGYLNSGNDGQGTFLQRIERLSYGDEFQLVLLQGGSNDQNVENAGLAEAVDVTVNALKDRFPSAQLVMLGPVSVSTNSNANKRYVNGVLEKYARDHRIAFISPLYERWFPTKSQSEWVNIEVGHPNTAGYDHMAQELATDLGKIVIVR